MKKYLRKQLGFSLIELVLVLAIASSLLVMMLRFTTQKADEVMRDRLTMQMQQVLNAALAYYIDYGQWPSNQNVLSASELVSKGYLPNATRAVTNPWGLNLASGSNPSAGNGPLFFVNSVPGRTTSKTAASANIIAGRLPMGYTTNWANWDSFMVGTTKVPAPVTCDGSYDCMVVASVSIPGQNLNNARSVNFGNMYHSGACVPVPTCPTGMVPNILVTPAQVYGVAENDSACLNNDPDPTACQRKTYPLTGYSAFATGGPTSGLRPPNCNGSGSATCYSTYSGIGSGATAVPMTGSDNYYRVCLSVQTNLGTAVPDRPGWGNAIGTVMALTRCIPSGEPVGSDFRVWSQ